jgi:hypothetical protein
MFDLLLTRFEGSVRDELFFTFFKAGRLPFCALVLALRLSRFIIIVCASLRVLSTTTQTENSKHARARVHIKN